MSTVITNPVEKARQDAGTAGGAGTVVGTRGIVAVEGARGNAHQSRAGGRGLTKSAPAPREAGPAQVPGRLCKPGSQEKLSCALPCKTWLKAS